MPSRRDWIKGAGIQLGGVGLAISPGAVTLPC